MTRWNDFLESLGTKGGNLFVLCFFTILLMAFVLHVSYHPNFGAEIRTVAISSFAGVLSALVNTMVGTNKPMNGSTTHTEVATQTVVDTPPKQA